MDQFKLVVLLAVLFVAGTVTPGFADDAPYKWEVSAMGGGVFPTEDDQDAAAYAGGRLIYNINDTVGVGVESGWENFKQEEAGQDYGDVTGIPLLANLVLRLPNESKFTPYLLGGVGVIFWNYDESSLLTTNGISVDSDTAFAGKIGGGVDLEIKENIALFAEGGYVWSNYDAEVKAGGSVVASTIDTDTAYVVGGLKFSF